MDFDKLTPENFAIYATKNYDTRTCSSLEEFNSDLRRFQNVKRLLLRYVRERESINPRMLLNHIVILNNIFGPTPTSKMLFFFCPTETHSILLTALEFLNILPENIGDVNLKDVTSDSILLNTLEEL